MKLVAVMIGAAALTSACASTTPQTQLAANESCGSLTPVLTARATEATLIGGRTVGSGSAPACAVSRTGQDYTPAALHDRVDRETRARTNPGRG